MAVFTKRVLEYLERHHGIAGVESLRSAGLSPHAIRELVAAGNLETVLRGAYRMPAVPFDDLARCAAVCAAHPDVVIAGVTAGRIWGFRRLPADRRIHVLAPPASQPSTVQWMVPYRTSAFRPGDLVRRSDGISLTTRARTALDLSRTLTSPNLLSIIEQAMHDGPHSSEEMYRVAADWCLGGDPGFVAISPCSTVASTAVPRNRTSR